LILTCRCEARMLCAPSIEWLVDQSDSIGIYKVDTLIITDHPTGGPHSTFGTASLKCTLIAGKKGNPPFTCETNYMIEIRSSEAEISQQIAIGDLLVCFFHQDGGLEKVWRTGNLTSPPHRGDHALYSSTFNILKSEADIINAINTRLNSKVNPYKPELGDFKDLIRIPRDKEAYESLQARSGGWLIIPPDLQSTNSGTLHEPTLVK